MPEEEGMKAGLSKLHQRSIFPSSIDNRDKFS
jgi:hypothetical protein